MKHRLICVVIAFIMIISMFSASAEDTTQEQVNALAMLNHLTVLAQETNDSKNSRIFLEDAYSQIMNNTRFDAVDNKTLDRLNRLLDTMERFRMTNVKRERLQFIYEQNQAQAIRTAVPNPISLLSTVHSLTPARMLASVVYMAVDSVTSYQSASQAAELQYLKDGWALDDEEAQELHQSNKDVFTYIVNIVNKYNLDSDLALTEEAVKEFSKWKNETNVKAKLLFLKSNQETYKAYGGYWLTLADAYYNNEEYQNCIEAIKTYEGMKVKIFKYDFEYAKTLPLAISAAEQIYPVDEYAQFAAQRAEEIKKNTRNQDWALRYFAAQTFMSIYEKTGEKQYLQQAFDMALVNVNTLRPEQLSINKTYLTSVVEVSIPSDATKEQKEEIKKYNQMLKETRRKELPPVSDALCLNCDLLFALADLIPISADKKNEVDEILHPKGERLFLNEVIDDQYWFSDREKDSATDVEIEFGGTGIVFPAYYLTNDYAITVMVKEKNADEPVVIKDWTLDSVNRGKEGDISTYVAVFSSEEAKRHIWEPESNIFVDIYPYPSLDETLHYEYTAEGTKKNWYDYLKVWEGHKNEWYDYLKVWDNSVNFIRVE